MIYISQVRIHPQEKIIKFKASQLWNKLPTQLAGCQLRWAHPQEKIIKFKASQLWNKLPTQLAGCQLRWAFVLLVYLPFSKLYIIVC